MKSIKTTQIFQLLFFFIKYYIAYLVMFYSFRRMIFIDVGNGFFAYISIYLVAILFGFLHSIYDLRRDKYKEYQEKTLLESYGIEKLLIVTLIITIISYQFQEIYGAIYAAILFLFPSIENPDFGRKTFDLYIEVASPYVLRSALLAYISYLLSLRMIRRKRRMVNKSGT